MKVKKIDAPNNKTHPMVRLNTICPYFTMFPLSFPLKILSNSKTGEIVFDPFCGRGTTNYAARLFGNKSYGIDSNPVAQAIAKSKLVSAKPEDIVSLCRSVLDTSDSNNVPVGEFWELAFHPRTLIDIIKSIPTLENFLLNQVK